MQGGGRIGKGKTRRKGKRCREEGEKVGEHEKEGGRVIGKGGDCGYGIQFLEILCWERST